MKYIILYITLISLAFPITLQEAYDNAQPGNGYDKYVLLEPNQTYQGGIGIFEGSIYINCQGSVIDLMNGGGIWLYADQYYNASLDIEYCTIYNGENFGIDYAGISTGNISNCNFIKNNIGLTLHDSSHVILKNSNFIDNDTYGLGFITEIPILEVSYSNFWDNLEGDCMENCPGWGNIWTPWEPEPGDGIIYENPQFVDIQNSNFNLRENSPCINAGNPNDTDPDGSIRDIGPLIYNNTILGDCSGDDILNVLDVIFIINNCVFNSEAICVQCSDLDLNGIINILDVVMLVNIILETN